VVFRSKLPVLYVGIPMLAGLSISHGFLPPHPSPAALVNQFGADMGVTLLYGLLVGIPTLLIAGPIFALSLRKVVVTLPDLFKPPEMNEASLPSTFNSFACALLPVVLIATATALSYAELAPRVSAVVKFIGDPMIGLLLSLAIGTYTLGAARGLPVRKLMLSYADAVRDIAAILLIIAGAGALKQIFVDSGANNDLGALLANLPIHPLVLGWLVALVIRIALGSATVAGLTAAGIVAPLVHATGVDPNWMVLAVGAGSLMCSHINDSGFWMCKEYFNLSLADTFRSWSLMETIVGSMGLILVLIFSTWL
jgi:Gnt-I system high-affinity gluconate transporter